MYSENDDDENTESQCGKQSNKRRKCRTKDFTDEEKRILIALVKSEQVLWDGSSRSNSNALDKAWSNIAFKMNKPKEKVKLAWIALRESYRYHERTAKRSSDPLCPNKIDYEFAKDLAFLGNAKRPQKSCYPYIEDENESSNHNFSSKAISCTLSDDEDAYHYPMRSDEDEYRPSCKRKRLPRSDEDERPELPRMSSGTSHEMFSEQNVSEMFISTQSPQRNFKQEASCSKSHSNHNDNSQMPSDDNELGGLVYQLGKLIKTQREFLLRFADNVGAKTLCYQTHLVACDALLQQLPSECAVQTLVEIQNYILKKVNDQHQNISKR